MIRGSDEQVAHIASKLQLSHFHPPPCICEELLNPEVLVRDFRAMMPKSVVILVVISRTAEALAQYADLAMFKLRRSTILGPAPRKDIAFSILQLARSPLELVTEAERIATLLVHLKLVVHIMCSALVMRHVQLRSQPAP